MSSSQEGVPTEWNPCRFALWINRWCDDTGPTAVLLRHPTVPFVHPADPDDEDQLRAGALDYLEAVNERTDLDLPKGWLDDLRWSRFESFWFKRGPELDPIDRTLVLSISRLPNGKGSASELGIRVVAHVRSLDGRQDEVRIAGMSASFFSLQPASDRHQDYEHEAARRTALEEKRPESYRPPAELSITPSLNIVQRLEREVFQLDPASRGDSSGLRRRRPTRDEKDLRGPRTNTSGGAEVHMNGPSSAIPDYPLERRGLKVVQTWFVPGDDPDKGVKTVTLPGEGDDFTVRSNDFSAISAFYHFAQLFARFERYYIDPDAYFRFAELPLKVFYRSGMARGRGKDGQTINARVRPKGWNPEEITPPSTGKEPTLEVHLALANLSHRARRPWNRQNRSPAEPLGIATDPRWVWHEIGHVLLMASVGELELRFAHSPGDALAAIVADPHSELAEDLNWRGATFPWVFVPRRHDRCVLKGWSWGGSMHRPLDRTTGANRVRRKGYRSEQILSSSLFRLYRCLGGDTLKLENGRPVPDREAREGASDYTVFLIMKGLSLLGDARLSPADHADQLVTALIDADIGTEGFPGLPVGGCAHKAIRWAFEAQGLYAADPDAISNAPGAPEKVDIYIEDRRCLVEVMQGCEVGHNPGSYVPVSLDWGRYASPEEGSTSERSEQHTASKRDDGIPHWFAKETAIELDGDQIFVTVGNRGSETAAGVSVRVWSCPWPEGKHPPLWDKSQWSAIGERPAQDVPPRRTRKFGGFGLAPKPGRYLVFAQATCEDDRANSDPSTGLPCSRTPTPLADLVANDNNLGLTVISYS
jgi:hypothetical protein